MTDLLTITQETIQSQIFTIRGQQVMLNKDLALLYGVETRVLNQSVKRNIERFPDDFMFELTEDEITDMVSQNVIPSKQVLGGIFPRVFTEHGALMLSSVLRSDSAVKVSIKIMRAFVEVRKFLRDNAELFVKINTLDQKQSKFQYASEQRFLELDDKFDQVLNALESKSLKPRQGIFYDGQMFDAYVFVSDLIRSAKQSIVLIDNYVDDTVLNLFTKRAKGISLVIYTQKISSQLTLDLQKHNAQYDHVVIREFKNAHDRFMILDGAVVYHIGASLKDLGRKWFAFSKMALSATEMLKRLA